MCTLEQFRKIFSMTIYDCLHAITPEHGGLYKYYYYY